MELEALAGGVRTRIDLLIRVPGVGRVFIEVKTGSGRLTPNQAAAFPTIRTQGGTPVGVRAQQARLRPGASMRPTPVWEVHVP